MACDSDVRKGDVAVEMDIVVIDNTGDTADDASTMSEADLEKMQGQITAIAHKLMPWYENSVTSTKWSILIGIAASELRNRGIASEENLDQVLKTIIRLGEKKPEIAPVMMRATKISMLTCEKCGSAIVNETDHITWHSKLEERLTHLTSASDPRTRSPER